MNTKTMTAQHASILLLIEGFVSVSLQMIALRQIVPFVGSSVPTTSIVITGFLAALAFGYRTGGKVKTGFVHRIERNLKWAMGSIALLLSYFAAGLFFEAMFFVIDTPLIAVSFYVLIMLMPIVYLLSESVIVLVNFQKSDHAAEKAGDAFNVSTWGNVVGGLITTLVVMYYLGVAWAIFINVALLAVAFISIDASDRAKKVAIAIPLLIVAWVANVIVEDLTFFKTTAFANYRTIEMADGAMILDINDSNASRTNDNDTGHQYLEVFEDVAFKGRNALNPKTVLVLGAGGFTFGRGRDLSNTEITFVDVDAALQDVGVYFLEVEESFPLVVNDARAFLLSTKERYDLIVLDTFSHVASVPAHLVTVEFFDLLRTRLSDDGVLFINTIARKTNPNRFKRGLDNTIREAFSECNTHIVAREFVPVINVLYQCTPSAHDSYRVIYSDRDTRGAIDSATKRERSSQ